MRLVFAVATVLCLAACCMAQEEVQEEVKLKSNYMRFKDVPGIQKGEDGQWFIDVAEQKYYVAKDGETKLLYFINAENSEPQWHDPRGPAPTASGETIDIKIPVTPPSPKASGITVALVAMLPILLFAGGTAARVAYLQIHHPELLWPTRERRDRRKSAGGKFKPQKARGKMSQDGKGGRSANS
ncbi:hypothetical protein TSOC_004489 [Tetrabaena socialis]|uniref:WW domain-containing protein n=1 Tax=Tetrabaena socialis TaxID=47790 RepID=A0A2J8A8S5_9CHLO|nr:hypothetical protein TSOC_004489 [Tetrabaena socialis]|eukprot:PNH08929.1 hypothetical protein TSOC_004489 [Tetrabaena socialis]